MKSLYSLLFCIIFVVCSTINLWSTEDDIFTDIILINGKAVLADFDFKGEIIKKYSEIPYYFSSYQSHESIVKKSTVKYKGLSVGKAHKVFDLNHYLSTDIETSIVDSSIDTHGEYFHAIQTSVQWPFSISFISSSAIRPKSLLCSPDCPNCLFRVG